ncbi:MAG: glycosyltransferase family 2 protein [Muribaculaceae bacterium]|nr:glycosyltransferase family 2 protein [Muribaculaceae bacterium]
MNDLKNSEGNLETEKKPFFSIIMPVYNAGAYIKESLRSISSQDFQDWELIIVDDRSTDDSLAKVMDFSRNDKRIKIFTSTVNSGRAHIPRLRAAGLATGRYIVTVDADDVVSSDLLSTHYQYIASQDADLVIPEMWNLKDNKREKILPKDSIDISKTWVGKDLIEHTLVNWEIPMAGFAVRRELYLKADEHMSSDDLESIFSDELHSRWLLAACDRVCLCDAQYDYRQHAGSITHRNLPRFIDSRLHTCDKLISMTATVFGKDTLTNIKAIENKFFESVGLLRMINRTKLKRQQKKTLIRRISIAMNDLDIKRLKGHISSRYLALMSLPIPLARIALKIIDSIIKIKNGI